MQPKGMLVPIPCTQPCTQTNVKGVWLSSPYLGRGLPVPYLQASVARCALCRNAAPLDSAYSPRLTQASQKYYQVTSEGPLSPMSVHVQVAGQAVRLLSVWQSMAPAATAPCGLRLPSNCPVPHSSSHCSVPIQLFDVLVPPQEAVVPEQPAALIHLGGGDDEGDGDALDLKDKDRAVGPALLPEVLIVW